MEKIEISNASINLLEIVQQVARNHVSVELSEGQVPLARIVPIDKSHSMADLDRALRAGTGLGEDAEAYAKDVLSIRQSLGELDDPWES
ncbi:MAG: hypothetical protein WD049_09530 [Candidatus Paceibacterota bacterium]